MDDRSGDAATAAVVDARGRRVGTLRGPSAQSWGNAIIVLAPVGTFSLVGLLLIDVWFDIPFGPLLSALAAVGLVLGIGALISIAAIGPRERSRARAERAAGYTTMRWVDLDVPEVAPGTDVIIRSGGTESMPNDQYRAMVRWARTGASGAPPRPATRNTDAKDSIINPRASRFRLSVLGPIGTAIGLWLGILFSAPPLLTVAIAVVLGGITVAVVATRGRRLPR